MDTSRETAKVHAVKALHGALMAASGVPDAFRWCWYRHPMFAAALFTESVRYRFGPRPDIRSITSFLARIKVLRDGSTMPGFPCREAEALIRAALGEMFLLESVHPGDFSYPEIGISVLVGLFDEGSLSQAEWVSLLNRAQLVLEEGFELSPDLAFAEDDWFMAGMHDSPFAILNGDGSGNE